MILFLNDNDTVLTSQAINLSDTSRFRIPSLQSGGIKKVPLGWNFAAAVKENRPITFGLMIYGQNTDECLYHWHELERMFERARRASGPYMLGEYVTLWVAPTGASDFTYIDVLDGELVHVDEGIYTGNQIGAVVKLTTLPYARSKPIIDTTSVTLTNGAPYPAATVNRSLTVSGNEQTDATRTTNTQGDGFAAPDSSFGIWAGASNLVANGGVETNLTGYVTVTGATVTRDATVSKFGIASVKVVTPNVANFEGVSGAATTISSATQYTASLWVRGTIGATLMLQVNQTGGGGALQQAFSITATNVWQRVTVTATSNGAATAWAILVFTNGQQGTTFWIDGIQIETGPLATPYVETNGAAATRAASRVQVPAGFFSTTQGAIALRVSPGWLNTTGPGGSPVLWQWRDNATNFLELRYNTVSAQWEFERRNTGGTSTVVVAGTFTKDSDHTVIAAWTAAAVTLSIDGAAFVSTANTNIPTLAAAQTDVGSSLGTGSFFDGRIRWSPWGTGTLASADATTINGFGNTDPTIAQFPTSMALTGFWPAVTAQYSVTGQQGSVYRAHVPGDCDALCQVTLTDNSVGGQAINRVRLSRRSLPGALASSDFTPIYHPTSSSPGVDFVDPAALGGSCSRITASTVWQTIASLTGAAGPRNSGIFDVWAKVRDATQLMTLPASPQATTSTVGTGSLLPLTYTYVVVPRNGAGQNGPPTAQFSVTTVGPWNGTINIALIVADGFETNSFVSQNWGSPAIAVTGTGAATAAVNTTAALVGTYGAQLVASNGASGTASVSVPRVPTGALYANAHGTRFQFKISAATLTAGDLLDLAQWAFQTAITATLFYDGTNLKVKTSGAGGVTTTLGAISVGTTHSFELFLDTSNFNVSVPWVLRYYLDDAVAGTFTQVANGYITDFKLMAALETGAANDTATIYFDNYVTAITRIGAIGNSIGSINTPTWGASTNAVDYWLYWTTGATVWQYVDVGLVTSYTHTLNYPTGMVANSGTPPTLPTIINLAQLRTNFAVNAPTPTTIPSASISTAVGNSAWEMIFLGTIMLPPASRIEGRAPEAWYLQIQGKSTAAVIPTIDVDAVWLMPHDEPQLVADFPGDNLTTPRQWLIDTNRYGRGDALLLSKADGSVQGQADVTGAFYLSRGDNIITAEVEVSDGVGHAVADVVNARYTLQFRIVPRWNFFQSGFNYG